MPATPPPVVIHVGFAGARTLVDPERHPRVDLGAVEAAAQEGVVALLRGLPSRLGFAPGAFLCGISQVAVGGDTAFTRACKHLGVLQRVFLPQHLDAYLTAMGSRGPDFDDAQRKEAMELVASDHVIEVRLASSAADRHARFQDVNLEIARESDVIVCLVREDQDGSVGGTLELLEAARSMNRPVFVQRVSIRDDGTPVVTHEEERLDAFAAPTLPSELAEEPIVLSSTPGLPSGLEYCRALKKLGSRHANQKRRRFRWAALIIVVGHVLATVLAVIALILHHEVVRWLLGIELALLGIGLLVHYQLHHSHSIPRWATFRLLAEITFSVTAIGRIPTSLEHCFALPFHPKFRSLLRTLSVLHMRDTRSGLPEDWKTERDAYVRERLLDESGRGQIAYNRRTKLSSRRKLSGARRVFLGASMLALVSTMLKLLALLHWLPLPSALATWLPTTLGACAIVLPVLAVAALSLATAFDLDAKENVSSEMLGYLEAQARRIDKATLPREYQRLLIETESRLLGETVNWFARRSFIGIS